MSRWLLSIAACTLLAACSDSGSPRPAAEPEPPAPPGPEVTDLDATGVYRGRVVTDARDVALLTVTLARDGHTAMAIDSDDDEQTDILLWGETREAAGELHFEGRDSRDDSEVALTFTVADRVLSANLRLAGLQGEAEAALAEVSKAPAAAPAGTFARQDTLPGLTELTLAADGSVSLSAPCEGSGELTAPDPAVNIYHLAVSGDCLDWEALATLQSLNGNAVLTVTGADGLATRLYQP